MKYDLPERYQPKGLLAEYEADRRYWRIAADLHADCTRKAAGELYYGNRTVVMQPENYHYTYTVHTKARLTQGTMQPRFTTKKRDQSERVKSAEEFCTDWALDTSLAVEFERLVDDMCYGGAVALVKQAPRRGYEQFDDPPHTPMAMRIPINLWGCDPVGGSIENARHMWHVCIHTLEEMMFIAESSPDEWDMEAVKRLKPKPLADIRGERASTGVNRKEVSYTTFWARDFTLPESDPVWKSLDRSKCHGTIFRFGMCESNGLGGWLGTEVPEMLGPPVPFYGPRSGPYAYDGFTDVPGEVRKSSPLIANGALIEELNATERSIDVLANNAKTGIFVDGLTPQGVNQIQQFQHGEVVAIQGFDASKVFVGQIGGPPVELLARARELAAKVRRNLGMPDTALGEANGTATLGENEIANSHLELNTEAQNSRAKRLLGSIYLKAAWYGENDTRTIVQHDGNTIFGGTTKAEYEDSTQRALRHRMVSKDERDQFMESLPDDPVAVQFEDLAINVECVKRDPQSLARYQSATEFLVGVAPLVPLLAQLGGKSDGFQRFMDRGADEYRVAELSGVFDMQAASEVPVDGQQEEARTAPAPEQAKPRTVSPQTHRAAQQKPQKQASQMRAAK